MKLRFCKILPLVILVSICFENRVDSMKFTLGNNLLSTKQMDGSIHLDVSKVSKCYQDLLENIENDLDSIVGMHKTDKLIHDIKLLVEPKAIMLFISDASFTKKYNSFLAKASIKDLLPKNLLENWTGTMTEALNAKPKSPAEVAHIFSILLKVMGIEARKPNSPPLLLGTCAMSMMIVFELDKWKSVASKFDVVNTYYEANVNLNSALTMNDASNAEQATFMLYEALKVINNINTMKTKLEIMGQVLDISTALMLRPRSTNPAMIHSIARTITGLIQIEFILRRYEPFPLLLAIQNKLTGKLNVFFDSPDWPIQRALRKEYQNMSVIKMHEDWKAKLS